MPLLAAAAVTVGAALQSATGFGFSLIAAPLVFAAVGPPEAVGLLLVLSIEVNLLTLFTERRRPRPLGRDALVMLAWAAPGAVAGVAVLRALDAVALHDPPSPSSG
ncbi:MAG: TSUP family transporter [Solirubrobacteraceae bacterium]